jgi:hypothetical protein
MMDDYRGIAVSSAISKLYWILIMRRLDRWAKIYISGQPVKLASGMVEEHLTMPLFYNI